jgi:signal transduction histidine kinase
VRRRLPNLSLRWRLAAWVALVVLASSAVTFVAVYGGTGSRLSSQIDGEIAGDANDLAHALQTSGARTPKALLRAAEAYIKGQPFNVSSTVLFVTVPGAGTSTNSPELFRAQAPDDNESPAEQAQENRSAGHILRAPVGYTTLRLPDVGMLRVLRRALRTGDELPASLGHTLVGVGEPLASVERAQHGVARAFILAGVLALVGAFLAALLIGTRLSNPLRRMAAVARQVDGGDLHPRIHDVQGGSREVQVLAESFNHMLDRLTVAFAGQRAFVADASHELRTPLTVIRGQLEVLAAQEHPSAEEIARVEQLVGAEVARISRLVDDLLLLTRSEQTAFLRLEDVDVGEFLAELWDGVKMLAGERRLELGPIAPGTLRADPDRLAQALRNLLRNAIEHTNPEGGLVRLAVEPRPSGKLRFVVEDDGPGIPADQRELIFERFHRVDTARDRSSGGTGLGLSIVRAIAEAHGGIVRVGEAASGGTRMELELPGFRPMSGSARREDPLARPVGGRV